MLSGTTRGLRLSYHASKWTCLSFRDIRLRHGTSEIRHRGLCFLGPNKPHGVHDQDGSPCSPCLRNDTEWPSEDTGPVQVQGRWGSNTRRWRWIGSPISNPQRTCITYQEPQLNTYWSLSCWNCRSKDRTRDIRRSQWRSIKPGKHMPQFCFGIWFFVSLGYLFVCLSV